LLRINMSHKLSKGRGTNKQEPLECMMSNRNQEHPPTTPPPHPNPPPTPHLLQQLQRDRRVQRVPPPPLPRRRNLGRRRARGQARRRLYRPLQWREGVPRPKGPPAARGLTGDVSAGALVGVPQVPGLVAGLWGDVGVEDDEARGEEGGRVFRGVWGWVGVLMNGWGLTRVGEVMLRSATLHVRIQKCR